MNTESRPGGGHLLMRITRSLMLGACLLLSVYSQADPELGHRETARAVAPAMDPAGFAFTAREQEQIRSYFRQHAYDQRAGEPTRHTGKPKKQKRLPPGLRKKLERGGELPPGWQRKLARGEVIDAELYAVSRDLPDELNASLGDGPVGTQIRRIEDEVFRLIEATGVIVDVLGL